ncbi:hypothetical protein C0J52_13722 [Blattella germanica]|nr:hypothetical protein C0J52_13722 [Blattella germanica]
MGGFVCPLCCDEIFENQLLLSYHLLSIADNLFCTECNQRFDDIRQFAQHLDGMCGKEKNEDIMSTDELNKIINEKYDPPNEMENQMEINSRDVSHIKDSMVTENAGSDQEILENVAIQDIVVNYGIEIVNGNNEIMEQQDVSSNDHQCKF